MSKPDYPCDACAYDNPLSNTCPGLEAHCAAGDHCIAIEASCAMEFNMQFLGPYGDHGNVCCHCKEAIKKDADISS